MTHINWDVVFHVDPLTLEPAASGVPVPTYGNYGGPGYSEGVFGPPELPLVPPADDLDRLFRRHDVASAEADTAEEQAAADLRLLKQILRFEPGDLDAEGSLYGGLAVLAMIEQLAAGGHLDLLGPRKLAGAVQEAVEDIGRGLAGLDLAERLQALEWLGEAKDAFDAAGVDLGDLLAGWGLGNLLPDGDRAL